MDARQQIGALRRSMRGSSLAGVAGIAAVLAVHPAVIHAQALDEKLVTAQAHAFDPKGSGGERIAGIRVAEIRWLLDRQQIRDCLTRYVRGLDRHDELLLASAFWPDARIAYGNTFSGTRDKFVRWAIADDTERMAAH